MLCSTFKEYKDRPDEQMKRGIFFPDDGESPLWVWIQSESEDGYEHLVLEGHLKTSSQSPRTLCILIQHNQARRRALRDTLAIVYCDKNVLGDSHPNQSIQAMAKTYTVTPWYGPVLVMKTLGLETGLRAYGDMDLAGYRDAVDSLKYDYLPSKSIVSTDESNTQPLYSARTVQGVIISCSGDIEVLGADKFIPVEVSIFDPVFGAEKSTSSEMVGVPIRVRKLPPHPDWKDSRVTNIYGNQQVTRLFRCMEPENDGFGLAPMHWDLGLGSVLVAREDGKDITPLQVEALCYYSSEHTQETFSDAVESLDCTGSHVEMNKLIALFTSDKFREFFADFKTKKAVEDARWVTAESPV